MIIIAGYTRTESQKRDAAVDAFAAMVGRARKQDGCLDLSISSDAVDPERINVFECWRDEQSLNAWRKNRETPTSRSAGRPRETLPQRQSRGPIPTQPTSQGTQFAP